MMFQRSLTSARFASLFLLLFTGFIAPNTQAQLPDTFDTNLPDDGVIFFEAKIRPVLIEHCYQCHSTTAEKLRGNLYLDTKQGTLKGGDLGPAVVPENLRDSLLIEAIRWESADIQMPPKKQLPPDVIADLERWVAMGAPDPRNNAFDIRNQLPTEYEIDWETARDHWAYKPPVQPAIPNVQDQDWPHNTIDNFTLAEMETQGLTPVADANRETLIRRLYFDLIGLPPTPQTVQAFVADRSPDAIETAVDRLLAMPEFGDRWGRHWLDIARYAESTGKESNVVYPHAWRYRDYVIDAYNADLPYDQFIREQIAGDLIGGNTPEARDQRAIATAFLALGPKSLNENNRTQFALDLADEQIDTITRSVLATTVACARCHDHKFDPITQDDYYALAGIFASTETHYGTAATQGNRRPSDLIRLETQDNSSSTNTLPASQRRQLESQLADLQERLATLQQSARQARQAQRRSSNTPANGRGAQRNRFQNRAEPAMTDPTMADPDMTSQMSDTAAPNTPTPMLRQQRGQANRNRPNANTRPNTQAASQADPQQLFLQARRLQSQIALLEEQLANYDSSGNPIPYTMGVAESPRPQNSRLYIRGEADKADKIVPRGFPTILLPEDGTSNYNITGSGRTQLADLLTAPNNPLTARVYVNRVWQHLIGSPLVATPDNFGTTGQTPTHPQLLDHLAITFMADGWSTKQLIKNIVTSHTYQLAAADNKSNAVIDQQNTYLWRANRKRLEGEAIRDAMLFISGSLVNSRPHGSPVSQITTGTVRRFDPNTDFNHRSVYLPIVRDMVPESLAVFDFAEPSLVIGQRDTTTVPSQALYLMNEDFVRQQAANTARWIIGDLSTDNAKRIDSAFWNSLSRRPNPAERQWAVTLLTSVYRQAELEGARPGRAEQEAWTTLIHGLFMTAEFRYLD